MNTRISDLKHNYYVTALIAVALGLVLIIWPDLSGKILCYLLGIAVIIMGVIQFVGYLKGSRSGVVQAFSMTMGLVLIAMGIWVCTNPNVILSIIPIVIGIMMLFHGCMDLEYTLEIRKTEARFWWMALILALFTVIMGIFLVLHPFLAYKVTIKIIGIGILYDGISDLILMITTSVFNRKYNYKNQKED